jgi:hypothetical protein
MQGECILCARGLYYRPQGHNLTQIHSVLLLFSYLVPDCYYTCNLLPLGLVADAGFSPRWLGNHLRDPGAPAHRDALSVHSMTCPYVTKLVAAAEEVLGSFNATASGDSVTADCLAVPGGCDAMRRLGDLLAATYPGKVYVLQMPRSSGTDVTTRLAADLEQFDDWLRARLPGGAASASAEPPTLHYAKPPRPGGVFVVSGPLSNDSLLGLVDRLGGHVSGLESCTSPDRWEPLAPATSPGAAGDRVDYRALADRALAAGMCPRRSTAERRAYLDRRLDEAKPGSIVYARQSFCDPGAYDALLVSQLAQERNLPYLEIEVDFPFDANGPLSVRVEAFLEAQLMDDDLLSADDLFEEL